MSVILPRIFRTKSAGDLWIRSAVPQDAQRSVEYKRLVARESGHFFMSSPEEFDQLTPTEESKRLELAMMNPCALVLIAELDEKDGQRMVAMMTCENGHRQRIAHIAVLGISILREFHRQGLGMEFMRLLTEWARGTGKIEKLELLVDPRNSAARALYEKLGYEHEAHIKKRIKFGPGDYGDSIQMGLWL